MKELHVTVQIRNNLLRSKRVQLGFSGADVCRATGVVPTTYSKLERLLLSPMHCPVLRICRVPGCNNGANYPTLMLCKRHKDTVKPLPFLKHGPKTWRPEVIKVAAFYKCEPAALFPADVLCMDHSSFEKEMDVSEIAGLLPVPSSSMDPESLLRIEGDARERDEAVSLALRVLTPRERHVLEERFGFSGAEPKTFRELSAGMAICPGRIQQIQDKALRKLRQPRVTKLLEGI
jgi:transcriptional regulator with XRE-family HTH domain